MNPKKPVNPELEENGWPLLFVSLVGLCGVLLMDEGVAGLLEPVLLIGQRYGMNVILDGILRLIIL